MQKKEGEEKLIIYLLSFCAVLMSLLYLFNQEAFAAKANLGLLSSSKEKYSERKDHKQITKHSSQNPSLVKNQPCNYEIKAAVLWRVPDKNYILDKLSPDLDLKRKEKALEVLNEREKQLNPYYEKALKISKANQFKRNLLRIKGFFKEAPSLEKAFNAERYVAKVQKEKQIRLDNYIKLFSNETHFKENKLKASIVEDFIKHYGIESTNYINQLFGKYPLYHEKAEGKIDSAKTLENPKTITDSERYKIQINHGRLKLISLTKERIKYFELSDEALMHVFKITESLLAIQALKRSAQGELLVKTENKLLNFDIKSSEEAILDFNIDTNSEIVYLKPIALEAKSLIMIKTRSLFQGEVICSNARALEFRQLLNSDEDDFLKIFLLKVNEELGDLDLIISTEKNIYKLTVQIIKQKNNGDKVNEIILD